MKGIRLMISKAFFWGTKIYAMDQNESYKLRKELFASIVESTPYS